jgi:hypothetical protein
MTPTHSTNSVAAPADLHDAHINRRSRAIGDRVGEGIADKIAGVGRVEGDCFRDRVEGDWDRSAANAIQPRDAGNGGVRIAVIGEQRSPAQPPLSNWTHATGRRF